MDLHVFLLTVGGLLLVGLITDEAGRRTRLPRVTLLILFGLAVGPSGLDVLPGEFHEWYDFLASVALTMVAFLLGGKLSLVNLRLHARPIIWITVCVTLATALSVAVGLALLGSSLTLALLLAGIATATDPAATQDVIRQTRARGPFTDVLNGVVALDDAAGLIAFSLLLVGAQAVAGSYTGLFLVDAARDIGVALAIGVCLGLPAAYLTGRLRPGEPIRVEALGIVFLSAGLALWAEVSFLLAGMATGAVLVNLARHHRRPFHEIEHIEWPFMIVFFVLAGASLKFDSLDGVAIISAAFLVLRLLGRVLGGLAGGHIGKAPTRDSRWIGIALIPQAGVALGMAPGRGGTLPPTQRTIDSRSCCHNHRLRSDRPLAHPDRAAPGRRIA